MTNVSTDQQLIFDCTKFCESINILFFYWLGKMLFQQYPSYKLSGHLSYVYLTLKPSANKV